MTRIPFNQPHLSGCELNYIADAIKRKQISGDGYYTNQCQGWLEKQTGCQKALLTHSCTAALEMAAILADIRPGDEVIMPSFTFVSTANAFVLRGGVPVFIDIRPDTMNMDENLIESAITEKTRAIVPVHYAGVACEMDRIMEIAERHNLLVIEDAAQGIMASYKGKPLGSMGHLAAFSFHETKNITSGEGGAILINESNYIERAEIIREKGTNRNNFFRGKVDKYTWVDLGSSYLLSEINAAFLYAQMENAAEIIKQRKMIWNLYYEGIKDLMHKGLIELQHIPDYCNHNAHMFYIKTKDIKERTEIIDFFNDNGVNCVFHYVPLHSSKAGMKYGRFSGNDKHTTKESERLFRMPIYYNLSHHNVKKTIKLCKTLYQNKK